MSRAEEAARNMTAEEIYKLGTDFRYGTNGKPEMPTTAVKYLTIAGERGDMEAQYALGCMYENGEGCIADIKEAVEWYEAADYKGHTAAKEALERIKGDKLQMQLKKYAKEFITRKALDDLETCDDQEFLIELAKTTSSVGILGIIIPKIARPDKASQEALFCVVKNADVMIGWRKMALSHLTDEDILNSIANGGDEYVFSESAGYMEKEAYEAGADWTVTTDFREYAREKLEQIKKERIN